MIHLPAHGYLMTLVQLTKCAAGFQLPNTHLYASGDLGSFQSIKRLFEVVNRIAGLNSKTVGNLADKPA